MKYILGIDPGMVKSAYVLLQLSQNGLFSIEDKNWLENEYFIRAMIDKSIKYGQLECAIETIVSYGMKIGQTTIDTSIWAGQFFRLFKNLNQKVTFITRPDIKLNLCHSRRAKQKNVKQALKDRFGELGVKSNQGKLYNLKVNIPKGSLDHIWSALAVTVTYIDKIYGGTLWN